MCRGKTELVVYTVRLSRTGELGVFAKGSSSCEAFATGNMTFDHPLLKLSIT